MDAIKEMEQAIAELDASKSNKYHYFYKEWEIPHIEKMYGIELNKEKVESHGIVFVKLPQWKG